ncbi:MAG: putative DNA modification/repair radical SAM protein [Candidatus Nanoarchaeia archaeon]|nr:putative DNA modification/repair radical SAM protein [Candidatus Nanoarchaeia archaeon]
MNTLEKIKILGEAGKYDICASSSSKRASANNGIGNPSSPGICNSFTSDGRCITLFKVLYSNSCTHDCKYCQNSNNCGKQKAIFESDELAKTFMNLYVKNYVEGFFLSSGIIKDADYTMDLMLECVKLLRNKYLYNGYIHLKIIPGASRDKIKQASELADRLSLNLEVPDKSSMSEISNVKDYKLDIIKRFRYMKKLQLPSGTTTQFVVGSAYDTDYKIMKKVNWMYSNMNLKRAYFSAFIPIKNTAFENKIREKLDREHRLYQTDFLMRKYNIGFSEIKKVFEDEMMPHEDPKILLANKILKEPIRVESANYESLLKVPGIGPVSAKRIIDYRKNAKIKNLDSLKSLGVIVKRAKNYIELNNSFQAKIGEYC